MKMQKIEMTKMNITEDEKNKLAILNDERYKSTPIGIKYNRKVRFDYFKSTIYNNKRIPNIRFEC